MLGAAIASGVACLATSAEPILVGLGDVTIIEGACLATLEVPDVRDLNLRPETAA